MVHVNDILADPALKGYMDQIKSYDWDASGFFSEMA